MLAELLESDHRQEGRPGPAARNDMKRRRRLCDLLAVPTGELLPHGLDHLGDLKLLRGDRRHIFRRICARESELRFQRGVFVRQGFAGGVHIIE